MGVMLTVRDWPNRNRLSTRVSLGSLNTILTLSGSSAGGSGGRHSDFLSFSSSSVWKSDNINQKLRMQTWKKSLISINAKQDSLVVSALQQEHSVGPSPPLASSAPAPPFSFVPSPGRHGAKPDRPHPAAALALGSGSSPRWNKKVTSLSDTKWGIKQWMIYYCFVYIRKCRPCRYLWLPHLHLHIIVHAIISCGH